jgi:hypothetical protein
MCSPECTIAALEVTPNGWMLCAEHGSLDEWHVLPGHSQHQTSIASYPNMRAFKNTMGSRQQG